MPIVSNSNHSPLNARRSLKMSSSMSTSTTMISSIHDNMDSLSTSSRQRQSKKDEAIRKKIEKELSKKRNTGKRIRQTKKITGTVSALRPSQALTMKESILVIEAAQLMAAKRSACVLVVNEEEHLSGIFTAKDLAYRVVANHLDPRSTTVSEIMSRRPMCVMADTSAQDALNLMVSRGFRHLPVCNEEGDIFGLLDITECLYEALKKMERAYESSKKLYDALEGVEKEWTNNSPAQVVQYMESLQEKMACPNLSTLLDNYNNDQDDNKNNKNNHAVVQVSVKAHVRDVAKLMKEHKTTAVLVMDHGGLAGIFTTKDIALRVIAAGLAPDNCSVIRVMTPHPDTATTSTSILEALKKMHDGHYLNLPILDDDRNICGLIDVLRLTYATLEQISSIEGNTTNDNSALTINNNSFINDNNNTISSNQQLNNGESKFWDNITGSSDLHDSDSVVSESSRMFDSLSTTPQPDDHRETAITPTTTTSTTAQSFSSTVGFNPNIHSFYHGVTLSEDDDQRSMLSLHTFLFKFSDGARTYRFRCHFSLSALRRAIKIRIQTKTNKPSTIPKIPKGEEEHDGMDLTLAYLDDENDQVLLTCDTDIIEAVELAQKMGYDRVKLIVHSNDDPVLSQQPSAENDFLSINTISEQHESHYLMEQHDQQNQNQQCPSSPIHNTFPTSSTTTKLPNKIVPTDFNNCLATTSEEEVSSITPTTTSSSSNNSTSDSDESAAEQRYNYYQHRRSSHSELSDDNNRRKYHQNQHHDVDVTNDVDDMLIPAAITFLGAVIVGVFTLGR